MKNKLLLTLSIAFTSMLLSVPSAQAASAACAKKTSFLKPICEAQQALREKKKKEFEDLIKKYPDCAADLNKEKAKADGSYDACHESVYIRWDQQASSDSRLREWCFKQYKIINTDQCYTTFSNSANKACDDSYNKIIDSVRLKAVGCAASYKHQADCKSYADKSDSIEEAAKALKTCSTVKDFPLRDHFNWCNKLALEKYNDWKAHLNTRVEALKGCVEAMKLK